MAKPKISTLRGACDGPRVSTRYCGILGTQAVPTLTELVCRQELQA